MEINEQKIQHKICEQEERIYFLERNLDTLNDKFIKILDLHHDRIKTIEWAIVWIVAIEMFAVVIYLSGH